MNKATNMIFTSRIFSFIRQSRFVFKIQHCIDYSKNIYQIIRGFNTANKRIADSIISYTTDEYHTCIKFKNAMYMNKEALKMVTNVVMNKVAKMVKDGFVAYKFTAHMKVNGVELDVCDATSSSIFLSKLKYSRTIHNDPLHLNMVKIKFISRK